LLLEIETQLILARRDFLLVQIVQIINVAGQSDLTPRNRFLRLIHVYIAISRSVFLSMYSLPMSVGLCASKKIVSGDFFLPAMMEEEEEGRESEERRDK